MIGTLGAQEMMLILVLALIVFGPRKLPDIGKSVGKMLAEFRRASNDFRRTVEQEVEADKAATRRPTPRIEAPAAPPTPATPGRAATEEAPAGPREVSPSEAPASPDAPSDGAAEKAEASASAEAPPTPPVERPS